MAIRSAPLPTEAEIDHGVPLFLNQLCEELRHGPSKTQEISKSARKHGHDLLLQGFSISQVVHDYGDVCQSVTDLALELAAPINTEDFRTLNRCLDDAIAGAVTEYTEEQDVTRDGESHELGNLVKDVTRDGESHELRNLIKTATTAFEVLQTGNVGVGGSTGAIVLRSLRAMSALVERQVAQIPPTLTIPDD